MNLKDILKKQKNIEFLSLKQSFTQEEILNVLNEIVSTTKDFNSLKENEVFKQNFFKLVSLLYLSEQLRKKKDDQNRISMATFLFDENFISKLNDLNESSSNALFN